MRALRLLLLAAWLLPLAAVPASAAGEGESLDAIGHTMDGTYLDFSPFGLVELPRIFLVRRADGLGLETFGSTGDALRSGRYVMVTHAAGDSEHEVHAVTPGGHEAEQAGEAAMAAGEPPQAELTVQQAVLDPHDYLHSSVVPVDGELVLDFSITRHLLFALLAALLLAWAFIALAGKYKRGIGRTSAPRGLFQNMLETTVIYVRDEIVRPNLGPKTDRFLPYILTVFFFILTVNLFGLVPFGATATANISVTAFLALCTFVVTQFAGTKDYWAHIFNPPGIPGFVKVILVPIEIMGLFIKPFALAIRLFANMTAGHLVILNIIGLIFAISALFGDVAGWGTAVPSALLTLFIYGLELLVAFIQAYVFTMLSALFIGMAAAEHEHEHEDFHQDTHDEAIRQSGPLVHPDGQRVKHQTVGTEAAMAFTS